MELASLETIRPPFSRVHLALSLVGFLATFVFSTEDASAGGEVEVGGGFSYGTLSRSTQVRISGPEADAVVGYTHGNVDFQAFYSAARYSPVEDPQSALATYELYGIGLGTSSSFGGGTQSKRGYFLRAQIPIIGKYASLSESEGIVNDIKYKVSTLTTLSGGPAIRLMGGIDLWGKTGASKSFVKGAMVSLDTKFTYQGFAKESVMVESNVPDLAPVTSAKEDRAGSLATFSIGLRVRCLL